MKDAKEKSWAPCLNDYCPMALTSIIMRQQSVRIGDNTSSTIILNGCLLRLLLYSFYTHDCVAKFRPNSYYKFADDTTVVGQISNNGETEYRKDIECLVAW
eukprot:g27251.t1